MQQSDLIIIDEQKTMDKIMSQNPKQAPTPTQKAKKQNEIPSSIKRKIKKETLQEIMPVPAKTSRNSKPSKSKLNEKEDQIMKVLNYQNSSRFGNQIRKELKFNFTREQLTKKTLEQIDNILYRIRNFLNNRGLAGIYEQMVRTTAVGYENLVSEFYDINGFSELLLNNPAFWDAFEMWKVERTLPDIPPSFQLMYIVASTTMIAHVKNTQIQEQKENKKSAKQDKVISISEPSLGRFKGQNKNIGD